MFKISKGLGNLSAEMLRFYRQIGVEQVQVPTRFNANVKLRPLVPPAQSKAHGPMRAPWDEGELRRICDHVRAFDLEPAAIPLPVSGRILMGREGRDEDLDDVAERIEMAGRVGFAVMTWNFTALRASEGYAAQEGAGRGGAHLRDFDHARIRALPPLGDVGEHGMDEMWERLEYCLRQLVPVAEASGVKLAMHPNDPPVPEYRGVAQPLWNLDAMKRVVEIVDSPANCVFFDTGVTTEYGQDAVEAIRYFGAKERIGIVHFRNVRVEEPYYKYSETFIDEGDCDIAACMRAFAAVGYEGGIDPDHTPGIAGDGEETQLGWAYAVGQLRALRLAVY